MPSINGVSLAITKPKGQLKGRAECDTSAGLGPQGVSECDTRISLRSQGGEVDWPSGQMLLQ